MGERTSSILPASIRARSNMSFRMDKSPSAEVLMTSRNSRCLRESPESSSRSATPSTPVMGVRNSWAIMAKNSLLARDAASAAVVAARRVSS
ncbi:MAG: hypothetical protein BWY88_00670 [Synergistetes bacterium ADurb.Bin520]|nr:MAG: hypothetical protein BWY88_00670 [Synergistetes bacterium ADurb.Bin520]